MWFYVITDELAVQMRRFVLWLPVFLAIGIALYFEARSEPTFWLMLGVWGVSILLLLINVLLPFSARFLVLGVAVIGVGFGLASFRTHNVSAPVLGWNYYGSIEGTIVGIDRSASEKPRLTLADPVLERTGSLRTPVRVRVSLHSKLDTSIPPPGARILVTGHLSGPSGPVEPGGFDFQRRSWFLGLGAVGYTRNPVMIIGAPDDLTLATRIFQIRMALSEFIQKSVGGKEGGFASAILTGDRSAVNQEDLENLRRANLAHLLAISGLHMGLLTGLVFTSFRLCLAAFPPIALRYPVKKIAAVIAIGAGLAYLVLSGASVATERAFIMVAVMFGAVLLDRPAISLRAVAVAACLILVLWPEFLLEPGFQMSFAATLALVVCFRFLTKLPIFRANGSGIKRLLVPVLSLATSSLIAGAATAPFAAYHFNQVPHFGLPANMAALPAMGLLVMPAALFAIVLAPFGLSAPAFWVMNKGIGWILWIAKEISGWPNAVSQVIDTGGIVLPLITLGAVLTILLSRWAKGIGVVTASLGFFFWSQAERPEILVSDDGRLVGVLKDGQRALNRKRGSGFAANSWLENDGSAFGQGDAKWLAGFDDDEFTIFMDKFRVAYLWDRKASATEIDDACDKADLLLAPVWKGTTPTGCTLLALDDFRKLGAFSITSENGELKIETARQRTGTRLWNSHGN